MFIERRGSLKLTLASSLKSFNILVAATFCTALELQGEGELVKFPMKCLYNQQDR